MTALRVSVLTSVLLAAPWVQPVAAQSDAVSVVFLEPAQIADAGEADVYRLVADSSRLEVYASWLTNESARMALDLYAAAWSLTPGGRLGRPAIYYVALVPGGNHAAVGFRLQGETDHAGHDRTSFIKLAPEDWAFSTTFLHETGHVVLYMLNGGRRLPRKEIAAISHSTAALTDRGTAFDEGFAIHLETLAAHFTADAFQLDRYRHRRFRFGTSDMLGEFHRHAGDLLSFSQTNARYYEVRENNFAFSPAFKGPDYLRVQLEKSRDFASLRDANQLLQSEGFQASFFFGLLMRGGRPPSIEVIRERQQRMLRALAEMFGSRVLRADDPVLLLFVEAYVRLFPAEAGEVIDVLLDLSHGVFVDSDAAAMWREHYLGALSLDLAERSNGKIEAARARWRSVVAADLSVLYRQLGPQIRCEVIGQTVSLVAFGAPQPLSFDVNTVEAGIMRLVPGITETEIETWRRARRATPFADVPDFKRRAGLRPTVLARLAFP